MQKSDYQYRQDFLVSSADADLDHKLRYSSLTNYLIQIAWKHATNLGWGPDDLMKHKLVWVLSGLHIEMERMPVWLDTITIETWPKSIHRLYYLRDYLIFDHENTPIGKATSTWLLIDVEKRRPRLHDPENEVFSFNKKKHAFEDIVPEVDFDSNAAEEYPFQVRYSDVDINQHLTTTRYVDWMFDTFSTDGLKNKQVCGLTLNFLKELTFGQKAFMQKQILPEGCVRFQLCPQAKDKVFFRGQLLTQPEPGIQ